jgi:hypothetical protein
LRSTFLFDFAGVPNAPNLELNILRLFLVVFVVVSWRAMLHCSRRKSPPKRLLCVSWLVVRVGVLCCIAVVYLKLSYTLRLASPLRLALLCE